MILNAIRHLARPARIVRSELPHFALEIPAAFVCTRIGARNTVGLCKPHALRVREIDGKSHICQAPVADLKKPSIIKTRAFPRLHRRNEIKENSSTEHRDLEYDCVVPDKEYNARPTRLKLKGMTEGQQLQPSVETNFPANSSPTN